jgi:hypothetical protein
MAEEEREQQQQTAKQSAKAAKRQRQKERQRQQADAVAGEAGRGAEPATAVVPVVAAQVSAAPQIAANPAVSAVGGSLQASSNMSRKKRKGKRQFEVGQEASGVSSAAAATEAEQSHHQPGASRATAEASNHGSENSRDEVAEMLQLLGVKDAAQGSSIAGAPHNASAAVETGSHTGLGPEAASQPAVASQPAPQGLPASTLGDLLSDLLCPITQEPMHDPVVAADGCMYERTAIEGEWMCQLLVGVAAAGASPG